MKYFVELVSNTVTIILQNFQFAWASMEVRLRLALIASEDRRFILYDGIQVSTF